MLDENTIVAVGGGGVVLRSTDEGNSWTVSRPFGSSIGLNALAFVDERVGTVVGGGGMIARTLDGGLTWATQESGTTVDLAGVSFVNADVGNAVGAGGTILRTTDGGARWVNQDSGTSVRLKSVWLVDEEEGTAVGRDDSHRMGVVLRTTDGGQSWTSQTYFSFIPSRVAFVDRDHGMIVGGNDYYGNGQVLLTEDGGVSWHFAATGIYRRPLSDFTYIGGQSAIAVGPDEGVRTDDLGATWRSINFAYGYSVSFADENVGTTVGRHGSIARSVDSGEQWMFQSSFASTLRGVSMVDANTAVAVGTGAILRTDDGGENWRPQRFPSAWEAGYAVHFTDANTGTNVGLDVLRTIDGGETWTLQQPDGLRFKSVYFVDDRRGWILSSTRILRTDDGGDRWVTQLSDSGYLLGGIVFLDENTGIAVGYASGGAVVLRTTDGGAQWTPQVLSGVDPLNAVSFAGSTGTAVGWQGVIVRSSDGGQTWERQEGGTRHNLLAVSQAETNVATAVGEYGTIVRTVDGGQTWHQQTADLNPGQFLYGVSFVDADNGIVVGEGGLILRTWNGGGETTAARQSTAR
jgi:photosystem II stability/assembly factor-like uncharacterized protein